MACTVATRSPADVNGVRPGLVVVDKPDGMTSHDVVAEVGEEDALIEILRRRTGQEHPELVQKYMGSVVPYSDNYFAALNSAVVRIIALKPVCSSNLSMMS